MNKHIIYRLITLLLLLIAFAGNTQTPALNQAKYWEYRNRLKNEFMVGIGPEMGYSIPAAFRDTISGKLHWSDCTIDHGQYIAVLAIEYKLLDENNQNTDETIEELFYALYALNRLDFYAENYFGGQKSMNGFFVRDDISEDSLDMQQVLQHLNQGLPQQKISHLLSDYMAANPRNKEESLDQAILLVTGLGIVSKMIPPEVVYEINGQAQQFQDFESSLQQEAKNQLVRIVNYMKEGDSSNVPLDPANPNLYGIQGENWDFIIKNPVSYESVMRGDNALFLAQGYTGAKYHFTGIDSPSTDTVRKLFSLAAFLYLEDTILPYNEDLKVVNLDAMSNLWPDGLQADTTNTNYNALVLGPRCQLQNYDWIPMLHQLVFGGNNYLMSFVPPDTTFYNDPEGYYEWLLNLAPMEGPYNYNDSIWPNWEWSSTSRTIHPDRRGEMGTAFPGNYNGIDYMLIYNLYRLIYNPIVGIHIQENIDDVILYPNPSKEYINIKSNNLASWEIEIIDISGKCLIKRKYSDQFFRMNISSFNPGIYFIRITQDNSRSIKKLIII